MDDEVLKICLVVLTGLPAAGKSYFCTELNRRLSSSKDYKCHTVVYDDLIEEQIHESMNSSCGNVQNHYKKSRNRAFAYVTSIIESIICSHDNFKKHLIVIDDNMYYKSMRHEYYKLAKQYKTFFLQVYIEVDLNTTLIRNQDREQKLQVPEAVVRDMASKLETPGREHWELNSVTLNSNSVFDETAFTTFFEILDKCMHRPVHNYVKEKTGTLPVTKLQSIDLLLRKIVHQKLSEDSTLAVTFVSKKKEIFEKIKNCKIETADELSESDLYNYLESLFLS